MNLIIIYAYAGSSVNDTGRVAEVSETDPGKAPTPVPTMAPVVSDNKEEKTDDGLEEGQMRSYLSGLPVDKEIGMRRPIAIMLNNLKAAQPMCSISRADVVYEYVVEGAITRLMALFEDYKDLDKIGSVRSCREYFVYTELDYGM